MDRHHDVLGRQTAMRKKLAVGSWAYMFGPYEKNPVPLDEVLEKLQELGFDGLELAGFTPHASPEDHPTKADRQRLKQKLADHNLAPPASNDEAVRKQYMEDFKTNVEFCVEVGIPAIRVDTANPPPLLEGVTYGDAWNRIKTMWHQCAEHAAQNGVRMVWEFEPGFMFNKPSEVVKLHTEVDHPNFQILLDSCHAHMCAAIAARQPEPKEILPGGAVEFIGRLKGRIGHIHLIDSDNTLHNDETSTHAPFGTGVLDFDRIMPAILEAGYTSEWWSVDLCFWPQAWEVTAQSKEFVDKLIEKYGTA